MNLAPNGNPTNLTPEQYKLVRTPEFKAWFGDWENDAENSSKVVDFNGEPLPVFHGTTKKFNVFDREYAYYQNWYGLGFYFTDRIEDIKSNYTSKGYDLKQKIKVLSKIKNIDKNKIKKDLIEGDYLISVFLDIKKPINIFNKIGKDNSKKIFDIEPILKKKFGYDVYGFLNYIQTRIGGYEVPFEKSFSKYTYWEFENILRNLLIEKENQNITGEVIRAIYEILGFDGIIMNPYHIFNNLEKGTMNVDEKTNHYISFNPTQIKLSDGTNTTFDSNNPDIRYENGGSIEEVKNYLRNIRKDESYNSQTTDPSEGVQYRAEFGRDGGVTWRIYLQENNEINNYIHIASIDRYATEYIDVFSLGTKDSRGEGAMTIASLFLRYPTVTTLDYSDDSSTGFWQKIGGDESELKREDFFKYFENKFGYNPDIRYKNGGLTMKKVLLAPKPSNLTPEQYRIVRTPAFKAWFGDWENSPETSSKVVDSNGEPLVVYHGIKPNIYEFNVFDIYNEGVFFAEREYVAKRYSSNYNETEFGKIKSVFLNIRKPEFIKSVKYKYDGYSGADANLKKRSEKMKEKYPEFKNTPFRYKDLVREQSEKKGYDGFILENHSWGEYIDNAKQYAVFYPEQIKLADGTNTTFDSNNPDIRYKNGGGLSNLNIDGYIFDLDKDNSIENEKVFKINDNKGNSIGKIYIVDKNGAYHIENVRLNKERTGVGYDIYNKLISILDKPIKSGEVQNEKAKGLWDKLVKEGLAKKEGNGYVSNSPEYKNGGLTMKKTKAKLLANGKPSNLTPEQYKLVRTPAFKAWFGDWENDAENASKVVDSNGEPLVVYHGTEKRKFNIFKDIYKREFFVAFFSTSYDIALKFAEGNRNGVKLYFLNIKNIYHLKSQFESSWNDLFIENMSNKDRWDLIKSTKDVYEAKTLKEYYKQEDEFGESDPVSTDEISYWARQRGYNGILIDNVLEYSNESNPSDTYIVYNPNQIKLADGTNTTFDANNPDIRYKNGGLTMKKPKAKLLAPNGKQSNLTPEQYRLVRTPAFKAWFGDWENDAENSSKVVDFNGEPLVVYHGSYKIGYTIFKTKRFKKRQIRHKKWIEFGSFFTDDKMTAQLYAADYENEETGEYIPEGEVREFFLNIRNPIITGEKDDYNSWANVIPEIFMDGYKKSKNDGFIAIGIWEQEDVQTTYNVKNPEQIKLADGTNTTFDSNNPDIRYAEGGHLESGGELTLTSEQVEQKLGRKLHWWNDDVVTINGAEYKKVFLKPEYKRL